MSRREPSTNEPTKKRPARKARPFADINAAHMVAKVLADVGYEVEDIEAFLKKAQHVEFGLAAEDEFAAIAAWLGRCRIVHKLDQQAVISPAQEGDPPAIPDLLAVVRFADAERTVLIEVKTTEDFKLRMKRPYVERLTSYAALLGAPLLIAWRPRMLGWWWLFEPSAGRWDGDDLVLDLEVTAPENLMGSLFGDFLVGPKKGAGFSVRMEPTAPPEPTEDGYLQKAQVVEAWWHGKDGIRAPMPAEGVTATLMTTAEPRTDVEESGSIIETFGSTGTQIPAQAILRFIVGWACQEGERIHWRHVAEELEARIGRNRLLEDVQAAIGTFVHMVMFVRPQTWPDWFPEEWRTWDEKRPRPSGTAADPEGAPTNQDSLTP